MAIAAYQNTQSAQMTIVRDKLHYCYEEREDKWVGHYSTFHQILLAGDEDFSFSLSLALSFGSASNIVATSLDSYDALIKKYKNAKSNLEMLAKLGAYLLHGVDATKMKLHTDLRMRYFDRIIYNFPHAGFYGREENLHLIEMHRNLVHGFLRNASRMLRANGEIHVNHKTTAPFCQWNLEELATKNSLFLMECVDFKREDYPGYTHKRGDGVRCDEHFPLGKCSTFKFIISPIAKKASQSRRDLTSPQGNPQEIKVVRQQPNSVSFAGPYVNPVTCENHIPRCVWSPPATDIRKECNRIFGEDLNYAVKTFGQADYSFSYLVETLKLCFEKIRGMKQYWYTRSLFLDEWLHTFVCELHVELFICILEQDANSAFL